MSFRGKKLWQKKLPKVDDNEEIQTRDSVYDGHFGSIYCGVLGRRAVAVQLSHPGTKPSTAISKKSPGSAAVLPSDLSHRHLMKVLGLGFDQRKMDPGRTIGYYPGEPLRKEIMEELMLENAGKKGYQFINNLTSAIEYVHHSRIVHCNLLPEKIMCFGLDRIPKITGFCSAKTMKHLLDGKEGDIHFSKYKALEILCQRQPTFTKSADIYSLTVIVLQILGSGKDPFFSCKTWGDLILAKTSKEPPSAADVIQNLPQAFKGIMISGFSINPSERPNAFELKQVLRHAMQGSAGSDSLSSRIKPQQDDVDGLVSAEKTSTRLSTIREGSSDKLNNSKAMGTAENKNRSSLEVDDSRTGSLRKRNSIYNSIRKSFRWKKSSKLP